MDQKRDALNGFLKAKKSGQPNIWESRPFMLLFI